jgi:hypothetical protein
MEETEGEGLALSLPGEVWAEVAGFLSTRDLLRLASANSRLRYNTTCFDPLTRTDLNRPFISVYWNSC